MKKGIGAALGATVFAVGVASFSPSAGAQTGAFTLPSIDVTGYGRVNKSELANDAAANPASVTVIKFSDDQTRNLRDYTELIRPIMGTTANNFDQGGVGFGFTLRGFSQRSNGGTTAVLIDGIHPIQDLLVRF